MGIQSEKSRDTSQRIIHAATELFLQQGFRDTSLDDVAAAAGVTKPTVYSHFGSKAGLLQRIAEAHATARAASVAAALRHTGDPRTDLMTFGEIFSQRVLSDDARSWHRLSLQESAAHPEIGTTLFAAGPARVIQALKTYIKGETMAGRLTCSDPDVAAEQFLGLLIGVNPIRMMAGQPLPSKAKLRRNCRAAVDTFLAAFASPAS